MMQVGNQITDPKKGISLTNNSLGLTDKITVTGQAGRYITYTYGSGGDILRVKQYNNGIVQQTLDYVDGFVYLDGTLSYFGMAEGRVRNTGSALKPEYMLTDYQGNVRVSFEEQNGAAVVRQENSFYAFGLIMPNTHPSDAKLGPAGTALGIGVQVYEYGTGTWDAHTIVNTSLMVGVGAATFFAAPAVLTGIALYGIGDYVFDFGGALDRNVGRNSGIWDH